MFKGRSFGARFFGPRHFNNLLQGIIPPIAAAFDLLQANRVQSMRTNLKVHKT